MQKMQDRLSSLEKSSLAARDKAKWKTVINAEFMSSEESNPDELKSFTKRSLPWRSVKVTDFLHGLDHSLEKDRSTRGTRQRNTRIVSSEESSRPPPAKKVPTWAVCNQQDQ